MTAAEYHADRTRVSASSLKLFAQAPALWWNWRNGGQSRPSTPALTLGRMVHTLALEPDEFGRDFALVPNDAPDRPSSRQREAKKPSPATVFAVQWWDEFERAADGKTIVDFELYAKAEAIVYNLNRDPVIGPMLRYKGEVEKTIYFKDEETGIECKARLDKILYLSDCGNVIFDLKTAADASTDSFRRNAISYGYHIQAAHYWLAVKAEIGEDPSAFFFGTVETSDLFLTHPFRTTAEFLDFGKRERAKLMRRLAACLESGHFPGYCEALGGVTDLDLPHWALNQLIEERGGDELTS